MIIATPYDTLAYPSAVFRQAQPDRLAMIARLHGLSPAPVETARMLDIGGGDGLNVLSLATAFPNAEFVTIDLAPTAIARGRRLAAVAGISNVRLEVLDILEAADRLEGQFDYITAHGVYAWVPEPVRAAIFPLIGRLLAPNGVAMVSFNAMPGGHSRLAMRGLLKAQLDPDLPPREMLAAARALLTDFSQPREHDEPITAVMRLEAMAMLKRHEAVLFHDELGFAFAPQALADVAADAAASGLAYLNDAERDLLAQSFVWEQDVPEPDAATLVATLNALDYAQGRYFRNAAFVRAETRPSRRLDFLAMPSLWAAADVQEEAGSIFRAGDTSVEVADAHLAEALRALTAIWPTRMRVSDLFSDPEHLQALFLLATERMVDLHTVASPFVAVPGLRPATTGLVRAQLAEGLRTVVTLDHRLSEVVDPRARAFLSLLDGTRNLDTLRHEWAITGHSEQVPLDTAMKIVSRGAMLLR